MPRYFFHLRDDEQLIRHEEGADLPALAAARKEAALSAQAILLDAAGTRGPLDHLAIEIWDGDEFVEVVQVGVLLSAGQKPTRH